MKDLPPPGWSVTGPYKAPGETHSHFRVDRPGDQTPTCVLFVEGDWEDGERLAHAVARAMVSATAAPEENPWSNPMTYFVPEPPARPFARGDCVETVCREGKPMGRQRITKAGKRIVHTDCGRRWTQSGNRWDGERAYPFPTIRHVST